MELTLDQALQKGIEAHKAGKAQEADRYYTAILKANPKHADANHNMGVLAVGVGKVEQALPFFKTALETNPSMAQYWISYIDALIKLDRIADAKAVFDQAKSKGATGDGFEQIKERLGSTDSITSNTQEPPGDQLKRLNNLYTKGQYQEAQIQALQLQKKFPNSFNLYNIIGATNKGLGKLEEAINVYTKALSITPNFYQAYYNMAIILQDQGKLDKAIAAYTKAISIKPDYADAYNNMGNALQEQGKLEEAIEAYNEALSIKPCLSQTYWNLSGTAEDINEAKNWIEQCLLANPNHLKAKLTLTALLFYEGNKSEFGELLKSSLVNHPFVRSLNWAFNLIKLPQLYFHRWALFDQMIEKSQKDRPFYEFGVWRGEAFRYLIKTFKKGYGFDTFEGLPENWYEKEAGTYSSECNVPKVKGGEFIVGKFEDTLPGFFAEARPMASVINFDADLYSSTICALNHAKPVIDQHTILIFDEFIINKNWEQDEYKALEEFCSKNDYTYEVLAISFFTAQVAVKIIGI